MIPITKGQKYGERFHTIMSSCPVTRFKPQISEADIQHGIYISLFYPRPPSSPTDIAALPCVCPSVRLPHPSTVRPSHRPSVCTSVRPERRYRFNVLRFQISAWNWVGVVLSTMKQIAIEIGQALHFLRMSRKCSVICLHQVRDNVPL